MKKLLLSTFMVCVMSVSFAHAEINVTRVLGSLDAPVVIEEFSSLTCPYCGNYHNNIYPELKSKYVDTEKVRIIYRHYPLDRLAMLASIFSLTLEKERFFGVLEHMFFYQQDLLKDPEKTLKNWVVKAGFDESEFRKIVTNEEIFNAIVTDQEKIERDYGIKSTPLLYINGSEFNTRLDKKNLFAHIDSLLEQTN